MITLINVEKYLGGISNEENYFDTAKIVSCGGLLIIVEGWGWAEGLRSSPGVKEFTLMATFPWGRMNHEQKKNSTRILWECNLILIFKGLGPTVLKSLSSNPYSISLIDSCWPSASYHTSLSLNFLNWKMGTVLRNKLNNTNFYDINLEMLFGEIFTWHGPSKILPNTLSVAPWCHPKWGAPE